MEWHLTLKNVFKVKMEYTKLITMQDFLSKLHTMLSCKTNNKADMSKFAYFCHIWPWFDLEGDAQGHIGIYQLIPYPNFPIYATYNYFV